ncbi:MAG TPA: hypothetical protein VE174_05465 [Actinomycetota bacterium]|nr:hypothetical protein [Actinomycetota bacterium]
MDDEEREQEESRRPKVVDKRISAGGHQPPPRPATPDPEPAEPEVPEAVPSPQDPVSPQEPVWTPEQEAEARRIVEDIVQTPSLDWVLNAAVNLANVAGTKLEMGAAPDAQLAIDALAAIVNGLGSRLQDAEAPLKQTLSQLQIAYAQRAAEPEK